MKAAMEGVPGTNLTGEKDEPKQSPQKQYYGDRYNPPIVWSGSSNSYRSSHSYGNGRRDPLSYWNAYGPDVYGDNDCSFDLAAGDDYCYC